MTGGNILLASYPKSGNTWMRAFLSNLSRDSAKPVDINDLDGWLLGANRDAFEEAIGLEASELTEPEIERYRPDVYRYIAATEPGSQFLKTHEAFTRLPDGEPLVPPEATRGVVYIIRNPLDVAVSYAYHLNRDLDDVIEHVMRADYVFRVRIPVGQVSQRILSWSDNVLSWVDQKEIPLHLVRYEDMLARPPETFSAVARFCGLDFGRERLERAIDNSSFEQLTTQERTSGFRERNPSSTSFFRAGKAGGWREILSPSQVDRIVRDHRRVMERFGYYPL